MKNYFLTEVKQAVNNWWVSLLVGVLALVTGVWVLITPVASFAALILMFEVAIMVAGILDIFFAFSNRKILPGWGWNLTAGVLEVLLALMLVATPMAEVGVIMVYVVGFWMLFRSIWSIGAAFDLHQVGVRGWGWLLVLGILMVLFSFMFLLKPACAAAFIVVFMGMAIITYGISRIFLAFSLRSLGKKIEKK